MNTRSRTDVPLVRTIAASIAALIACGCAGGDDVATPTAAFHAAIVFDVGGVGDKSFNDSANRGLERARDELEIRTSYYEPREPSDRESGLRRFAAGSADVVFGIGFMFSEEITSLAREYPDLRFACVDMALSTEEPGDPLPPNLVALKFREEEGSFLAGALAALTSKTGKIGFIGGMNVPLIHKFEAGYAAGAHHVRPDIEVLVGYAGETPMAFKDAAKGKSLALGQYGAGADVIFHAAGQSGRGVFEAAREQGRLAIGVDSDQNDEAPGHVLTSMIKRVDVSVFETIRSAKDGAFEGGVRIFGLAEEGVGIVLDERNRSLWPEGAAERIDVLRRAIVASEISVPSTR